MISLKPTLDVSNVKVKMRVSITKQKLGVIMMKTKAYCAYDEIKLGVTITKLKLGDHD